MLLEDLVATGLSTLPPAFMHSSATDERLLVLPSSAADAARRLKRMVRGGAARGAASAVTSTPGKGGEAEGGSNDPTPPPVPETPTSRGGSQFSAAHADPLGSVAFDIPPDALPPPPARAAVARRTAAAALLAAAPQRPTPPPPAFQGAVDERAAGVAADSEGFGAFGDVTMLGEGGCLPAGHTGCVVGGGIAWPVHVVSCSAGCQVLPCFTCCMCACLQHLCRVAAAAAEPPCSFLHAWLGCRGREGSGSASTSNSRAGVGAVWRRRSSRRIRCGSCGRASGAASRTQALLARHHTQGRQGQPAAD
jgi:hypothetical protein